MIRVKSEFTADLLLSVLKTEPTTPLFLGFCVSSVKVCPADGQTVAVTAEVSDPAYSRRPVSFSRPDGGGVVRLRGDVQFPRAGCRWERVTHFGVFDALQGGHRLLLKPTGGVTTVEIGDVATVLASDFVLYLGGNDYSNGEAF